MLRISHGTIALAFVWGNLSDSPRPGTLWDLSGSQTYCGLESCKYLFYETTPDFLKDQTVMITNRSVEITGDCSSWPVISGGNGMKTNITLDNDEKSNVAIPVMNGPDQTIFMVDTEQDNTPWSIITAFEASVSNPWYYRCNISFGPVINAMREEHHLGIGVTALASSALALQGYGASSNVLGNTQQFQSYPAETWYGEAQNGSTKAMGLLMSRFTTGVLAVTALANSDITVPGLQPLKGVSLEITHWKYVHVILGLTLWLQLNLAVIVAVIANKVRVRDDSHLTMAVLLRPVLKRLGDGAEMASGKEIMSTFDHGETLRYTLSNGVYLVRLQEIDTKVGKAG